MRRAGFSLVEATIAMTISTILVLAVGSVFVAQSDFYNRLSGGAANHDNSRAFVQVIQANVASMVDSGFVVADSLQLVIRKPQSMAYACATGRGTRIFAHLTAGADAVDDASAAGIAKLDPSTGIWTFATGSINSVTGSTGSGPARNCFNEGTDTVGARDDFIRLNGLNSWFSGSPDIGDVYMIFEEVEFQLSASTIDSRVWALYKGEYGETLSEYASGIDSTAYFQYRRGGTWYSEVTGASNLAAIDAIRIRANSRTVTTSGALGDATFELDVVVPVRN